MKNSNKPAYPARQAIEYEYEYFCEISGKERTATAFKDAYGLTKREKIAAQNFASIIASIPFNELEHPYNDKEHNEYIMDAAAKIAIAGADALLKQLES